MPMLAEDTIRGLTRRWRLPEPIESSGSLRRLGLPMVVERLLNSRGMCDPEGVSAYCEPRLSNMHDPSLLPGAEQAAERLVRAVRDSERIVIYGDYDVDGITATAILWRVIRTAKPDAAIETYVPHRLEEGYGLNREAIEQLARDGANVIVSVDCGVTAVDPARAAREADVDLIITDHHSLPIDRSPLPDAFAIVHPRLPGSAYPFGELCGAGIAFKLAWRFATMWCGSQRVSNVLRETLTHMLPLAALGTIADVVPLVDENRIIAKFGLQLIKQTPVIGLRALIEASKLMDQSIDCEKVGFVLGPRLNACGRMGHAREAVQMLITDDEREAHSIAGRLAKLNSQRQRTERQIVESAAAMAEDLGMTRDDRRIIILADESWHPGVVGIVCSRLVERFGRPAILLQRQDDVCKGSARSIDGFSMLDALSSCTQWIHTFGGHDAAAGLTVLNEHFEAFCDAMVNIANESIAVEQLTPSVSIDCDATLEELDLPTLDRMTTFSPFGRSNPRPSIRLTDVTIAEAPKHMGSQGKHMSLRVRSDVSGGRQFMRLVWWNAAQFAMSLGAGASIEAVIEPKINDWNGRKSVEGIVKDVRVV